MFDLKKLEQRYRTDAAFNKVVNLTMALLRQHGFTPSEIREAQFYGQYLWEMSEAQVFIRTTEEQERFIQAMKDLKVKFSQKSDEEILDERN